MTHNSILSASSDGRIPVIEVSEFKHTNSDSKYWPHKCGIVDITMIKTVTHIVNFFDDLFLIFEIKRREKCKKNLVKMKKWMREQNTDRFWHFTMENRV